ncbi:MAG: flavin reductase family protein [Flavobacteriales bacterium]|nr:flavin reductase family protein [Flavobacteriales bacterium]
MKSHVLSEMPVQQRHGLLLGAIGPRPIAFASTIDAQGRPNLAPFSFFNCFGSNPPTVIFSPARRGRDNTTKHTYHNVKAVPEVVINVVNYGMVQQANVASAEYPEGVSEFGKAGFTPIASERIRPFRVKESPVQMECVVKQVIETGDQGAAGNLIICEVLVMHVDDNVLNERGTIDPRKIDLVGRMGGHWYCRANGDALFELPQPATHIGVGFDALPADVRNSRVLTGNDLGQLANCPALPDETSVNEYKLTELTDTFIALQGKPAELVSALHLRAQQLLHQGKAEEAWLTLLTFNDR